MFCRRAAERAGRQEVGVPRPRFEAPPFYSVFTFRFFLLLFSSLGVQANRLDPCCFCSDLFNFFYYSKNTHYKNHLYFHFLFFIHHQFFFFLNFFFFFYSFALTIFFPLLIHFFFSYITFSTSTPFPSTIVLLHLFFSVHFSPCPVYLSPVAPLSSA